MADAGPGFAALARAFVRQAPDDAARRLGALAPSETARLLLAEPVRYVTPVLQRLEPDLAAGVLSELPQEQASAVLSAFDPARAVVVLGWMTDDRRRAVLDGIDAGLSRELRRMAEYPPETAGRLMDPRASGFQPGATVHHALARVRTASGRSVSDVFVVDEESRVTGRVPLQALAVAAPGTALQALALPVVTVQAIAPQEEVVDRFTEGRLSSLPVVDFDGRLLGVIRQDTLAAAARQDVAGDMQAMVGVSRQERALSPVSFAVRKRLPWLEINLLTAFLAAAVVGLFEGTIARFTALAVLLPVVAGQSGNTGAQALAVTMRGLAMREIRIGQWMRVARKEASVALINGLAVAVTTSLGVWLWSKSPGLALVIGVSMVLSMMMAGLAGVLVPTVLTSVGQDPAQSASIILTTVTDVVGFASFLGIATVLAGML